MDGADAVVAAPTPASAASPPSRAGSGGASGRPEQAGGAEEGRRAKGRRAQEGRRLEARGKGQGQTREESGQEGSQEEASQEEGAEEGRQEGDEEAGPESGEEGQAGPEGGQESAQEGCQEGEEEGPLKPDLIEGASRGSGAPLLMLLPMTTAALEKLTGFFDRRNTRQAWVARRIQGHGFGSDDVLRDQLVRSALGLLAADGPAGDPLRTVATIETLVDLGAPADRLVGGLDSLLRTADKPGAFGEGCTAARHAHRVCEHFLGGFFAVAAPTQRVAPAALPNGRVHRVESQARFAMSCWILQVVIRAGRIGEPTVQRHLDSFVHLLPEWEAWGDFLVPDLAFSAMGALGVAPERWRPTLEALVRMAGNQQLADGTWPRVDFFNALCGLSRVDHPLVDSIFERALPGLLQRQRDDGSFGNVAADDRGLIALRVLRRLQGLAPA